VIFESESSGEIRRMSSAPVPGLNGLLKFFFQEGSKR
jgi:hypothetical protein